MEKNTAVLRLDKISKNFGGLQVQVDVDLNLVPEEIMGLIGPNGAGKSTLFNKDCPSGLVLKIGKIAMHGSGNEPLADPEVQKTFMGERVYKR